MTKKGNLTKNDMPYNFQIKFIGIFKQVILYGTSFMDVPLMTTMSKCLPVFMPRTLYFLKVKNW